MLLFRISGYAQLPRNSVWLPSYPKEIYPFPRWISW